MLYGFIFVSFYSLQVSTISRSSSSLVDAKHGPNRAALLEAASRVGDASRQLLQYISQPCDLSIDSECTTPLGTQSNDGNGSVTCYPSVVDWEARDQLLSATKVRLNRNCDSPSCTFVYFMIHLASVISSFYS